MYTNALFFEALLLFLSPTLVCLSVRLSVCLFVCLFVSLFPLCVCPFRETPFLLHDCITPRQARRCLLQSLDGDCSSRGHEQTDPAGRPAMPHATPMTAQQFFFSKVDSIRYVECFPSRGSVHTVGTKFIRQFYIRHETKVIILLTLLNDARHKKKG